MPSKTIIKPGQVYWGLYIKRIIQIEAARIIYKAGRNGYPKVLYGRSTLGLFFLSINTPTIVSI